MLGTVRKDGTRGGFCFKWGRLGLALALFRLYCLERRSKSCSSRDTGMEVAGHHGDVSPPSCLLSSHIAHRDLIERLFPKLLSLKAHVCQQTMLYGHRLMCCSKSYHISNVPSAAQAPPLSPIAGAGNFCLFSFCLLEPTLQLPLNTQPGACPSEVQFQ